MKKIYLVMLSFLWLLLFSYSSQATGLSSRNVENEIRPMIIKAAEIRNFSNKMENKEKEEWLIQPEEVSALLVKFTEQNKEEENQPMEQIGAFKMTEGISKQKTKLFTGSRKLLGNGNKDMKITLILFSAPDSQKPEKLKLWHQSGQVIGASKLFSADLPLNHIGIHYLLIRVEEEGLTPVTELIQLTVEDNKTKDKLENMTLQFLK